ncbi:MAG: hypothetical protein AVDCRST_MAG91-2805 [uncultured Sphingomonadaceae bacterium]|uniref:Uncharacterized protein n=1 Tax=uncultured Sphingomonadaceae bacterium TaxID=169976 RepID=A0A6J4TQX5_9SPHN|nr:MAG: hypothetical protein AVDCRST_MAG91-2805 [uncultured Sphingomonadaceae bacterium]
MEAAVVGGSGGNSLTIAADSCRQNFRTVSRRGDGISLAKSH